jgi:hypothetical protein
MNLSKEKVEIKKLFCGTTVKGNTKEFKIFF